MSVPVLAWRCGHVRVERESGRGDPDRLAGRRVRGKSPGLGRRQGAVLGPRVGNRRSAGSKTPSRRACWCRTHSLPLYRGHSGCGSRGQCWCLGWASRPPLPEHGVFSIPVDRVLERWRVSTEGRREVAGDKVEVPRRRGEAVRTGCSKCRGLRRRHGVRRHIAIHGAAASLGPGHLGGRGQRLPRDHTSRALAAGSGRGNGLALLRGGQQAVFGRVEMHIIQRVCDVLAGHILFLWPRGGEDDVWAMVSDGGILGGCSRAMHEPWVPGTREMYKVRDSRSSGLYGYCGGFAAR